MSRIREKFASLRGRSALVPFITAGFPEVELIEELVLEMEQAGADLIELGVPFSDPLADGPVIQRASALALKNGVTLHLVLEMVQDIREKSQIPILLMGYFNPILRWGVGEFLEAAREAGVDGLIIPDLPPEEAEELMARSAQVGMSLVFLIAPTTPPQRIKFIDRCSTDFSYCVSLTGVTGPREILPPEIHHFLRRVRQNTEKPFVVGFGISKPEHVEQLAPHADGVVVGSALIRQIEDCDSMEEVVTRAGQFIKWLKSPLERV